MADIVNICMITDNNYVIPTAVAMTSAICHKTKGSIYHYFILVNGVTKDNIDRLNQLKRDDVLIDFIPVDAQKYSNVTVKTHVPQSAALKFDIPNIIQEEKILYLDGDIIVQQDLQILYDIDIEQYAVAAVRDMGGELSEKFNDAVGCQKYFNSGVLLLNLRRLRAENVTEKLLRAKFEHPEWTCMDQDAFNFVLSSDTCWINVKYNSMIPLYNCYGYDITQINEFYDSQYENIEELEKDSVIIHLAGQAAQRPWKVSNGEFCRLWDMYYAQSPYKDIVLKRGLCHLVSPNIKWTRQILLTKLFGFLPLLSIEDRKDA